MLVIEGLHHAVVLLIRKKGRRSIILHIQFVHRLILQLLVRSVYCVNVMIIRNVRFSVFFVV